MSGLAEALRKLIVDWHGRKYGSTKALAERIQVVHDEDVYARLHRELEGRPSWAVAVWTATYCAPVDSTAEWRVEQLERLAGLWSRENEGKMPPGYAGRVVHDREVLRDAIASSTDASDPVTRAVLLEREREAALAASRVYEEQVDNLRQEVRVLKHNIEELQEKSHLEMRRFTENVHTLAEQLRFMQQQLDASADAAKRLAVVNDELEERGRRFQVERDEAVTVAEQRTLALHDLELSYDEAKKQFDDMRQDLESKIHGLRAELDHVERERRDTADEHQPSVVVDQRDTEPLVSIDEVAQLLRGGTIRGTTNPRVPPPPGG